MWVDSVPKYIMTKDSKNVGEAQAADSKGSTIVGNDCKLATSTANATTSTGAWVWTKTEGAVCLPGPGVVATSISDDGRVIGGSTDYVGERGSASIWIDRKHYVLDDYFKSHKVDTKKSLMTIVTAVSHDGKTLVGRGTKDGVIEHGWIANLPK